MPSRGNGCGWNRCRDWLYGSRPNSPRATSEAPSSNSYSPTSTPPRSLGLVSHDGSRLEWIAAVGASGSSSEPVDGPLLTDRCIATDATRSGTHDHPPLDGGRRASLRVRMRGSASMRLSRSGPGRCSRAKKPVGVIVLAWARRQPFDAEQLAYLSTVASMTGPALVRAKSYADEHARALVLHAAAHPTAQVCSAGMEYRAYYRPRIPPTAWAAIGTASFHCRAVGHFCPSVTSWATG